MPRESAGTVEVRGFLRLKEIFDQRNWPFPLEVELENECSAAELAAQLDLPPDGIEAVFVNGRAYPLSEARVRPGDRVGFVPPGTPGPYRLLLGIKRLPAR
ncbi:MAG: MoaD/ThiS family protein [Desulfotomaculales bacterium]